MVLVALTLVLILAGLIAYFIGAAKLAKYGFRISKGVGLAVLLFPPYTFYFSFKKLEVDGKELPTALCCFGLVLTILLGAMFWQPLSMTLTGDFDGVEEMMTAEMLTDEYRDDDDDSDEVETEAETAVEDESTDETDTVQDDDESDDDADSDDDDEGSLDDLPDADEIEE